MLFVNDEDYPNRLRTSLGSSAPVLLFVQGNAGLLHGDAVAIVGARLVSRRGAKLADSCATAFARQRVTVVSGAAHGVDTAAHRAAVRADGPTVAVLPQGLFTYHAPRFLRKAVEAGRGVLVSEFLPDASWAAHAAVVRNATISGLSRMVCVFEPKKRGGSIRTARAGLDQGKRVAVYYGATSHSSPAEELGRLGAVTVDGTSLEGEVLEQLWATAPSPARASQEELF